MCKMYHAEVQTEQDEVIIVRRVINHMHTLGGPCAGSHLEELLLELLAVGELQLAQQVGHQPRSRSAKKHVVVARRGEAAVDAVTFRAGRVRRVGGAGPVVETAVLVLVLAPALLLLLALLLAVVQLVQVELQVSHRVEGVERQGREFPPQAVLLLPLVLQRLQGLVQLLLGDLLQPGRLVQLRSHLLLLVVLLVQLQLDRLKLDLQCRQKDCVK